MLKISLCNVEPERAPVWTEDGYGANYRKMKSICSWRAAIQSHSGPDLTSLISFVSEEPVFSLNAKFHLRSNLIKAKSSVSRRCEEGERNFCLPAVSRSVRLCLCCAICTLQSKHIGYNSNVSGLFVRFCTDT